eukprot:GHVS01004069.1.p1 GENE.GHVS01004069.1~~GHVS01004069.1.p1  ORF type:complete len:974 (+),score=186.72 GHVS01004069.1:39-2960(+)
MDDNYSSMSASSPSGLQSVVVSNTSPSSSPVSPCPSSQSSSSSSFQSHEPSEESLSDLSSHTGTNSGAPSTVRSTLSSPEQLSSSSASICTASSSICTSSSSICTSSSSICTSSSSICTSSSSSSSPTDLTTCPPIPPYLQKLYGMAFPSSSGSSAVDSSSTCFSSPVPSFSSSLPPPSSAAPHSSSFCPAPPCRSWSSGTFPSTAPSSSSSTFSPVASTRSISRDSPRSSSFALSSLPFASCTRSSTTAFSGSSSSPSSFSPSAASARRRFSSTYGPFSCDPSSGTGAPPSSSTCTVDQPIPLSPRPSPRSHNSFRLVPHHMWRRIHPPSAGAYEPAWPGERAAHTCEVIGGELYLFGGWNGKQALNDLFIFNAHTMRWRQVSNILHSPERRNNHTSVTDGVSRLFVHGGHDGTKWLGELEMLNVRPKNIPSAKNSSSRPLLAARPAPLPLLPPQQHKPHSSSTCPSGPVSSWFSARMERTAASSYPEPGGLCRSFSAISTSPSVASSDMMRRQDPEEDPEELPYNDNYRDRGGSNGGSAVDDDGVEYFSWERPSVSGVAPSPRACHSLSRVGRKLYMFGGYDGSKCFQEVEVLDLDTMCWIQPKVKGHKPQQRNAHSMTVRNSNLFLFGGHSGNKHLTDVHVFSTISLEWSQPAVAGSAPPGLRGHSATIVGDQVFLFGGYDGSGRSKELYLLEINPKTNRMRWLRPTEGENVPQGRQRHTACLVEGRRLLVFGGFDGRSWLNDMYMLDVRQPEHDSLVTTSVEKLLQNLSCLVNNADLSDVVLVVNGEDIYAHRCILSASCNYFRSMFVGGMRESKQQCIDLPDVGSTEAFLCLLHFLYSGRLPPASGDQFALLCELTALADQFGLEDLLGVTESLLSRLMDSSNVCQLLILADTHHASSLRSRCLDFFKENMVEVAGTPDFARLESLPGLMMQITRLCIGHKHNTIHERTGGGSGSGMRLDEVGESMVG